MCSQWLHQVVQHKLVNSMPISRYTKVYSVLSYTYTSLTPLLKEMRYMCVKCEFYPQDSTRIGVISYLDCIIASCSMDGGCECGLSSRAWEEQITLKRMGGKK